MAFLLSCALAASANKALLEPHDLRVERLPAEMAVLAVNSAVPRFSWRLRATTEGARNLSQAAYQISAYPCGSDPVSDTALWDSGRVNSERNFENQWGASDPLPSEACVAWRVRVWAEQDGKAQSDPSTWSKMALFRVGRVGGSSDWTGKWISSGQPNAYTNDTCGLYSDRPNALLRKQFNISASQSPIVAALARVSGLGYYKLYLDGKRVGDSPLDPGLTRYSKRVLYSTYDVMDILAASASAPQNTLHVVGIELGNGWFNPTPLLFWGRKNIRDSLTVGMPMAIFDITLYFQDGSRQVVASTGETGWTSGKGATLFNDIYLGSRVDAAAGNALAGWSAVGFDDSDWVPAIPAPQADAVGPLEAQSVPPVRVIGTASGIPAKLMSKDDDAGVALFDVSRNIAGGARVEIRLPKDSLRRIATAGGVAANSVNVVMRYGEILFPNGSLNVLTSVAGQVKHAGEGGPCAPDIAEQRDELRVPVSELFISLSPPRRLILPSDVPVAVSTLNESLVVSFESQFTWHGYRYVEVSGLPPNATVSVWGVPMRSDVAPSAEFESSEPLLNRIFKMALDTHANNMMSTQSDCPHRERFGYGGDLLASADTALLAGWDMAQFYAKRVRDYADAQFSDGGLPETAPFVGITNAGLGGQSGPIGWDTVLPVLQAKLYAHYGDQGILKELQSATNLWIQFLMSVNATNPGLIEGGLSDWMSLEAAPSALTGRAFMYENMNSWARIHTALGNASGAAYYAKLANQSRDALLAEFLNKKTGAFARAGAFNGTQCAQALPLSLGLLDGDTDLKTRVENVLKSRLAGDGGHLRAGMFCIEPVLTAVSDAGAVRMALDAVNRSDYPSYGYMLANGATTLWESWFYSNNTYSHDHPMFSGVAVWMTRVLAGIRFDTWDLAADASGTYAARGHVRLALPSLSVVGPPGLEGCLSGARALLDGPRGVVETVWRVTPNNTLLWDIMIPPGTQALVEWPPRGASSGNMAAWVPLGSGNYSYTLADCCATVSCRS